MHLYINPSVNQCISPSIHPVIIASLFMWSLYPGVISASEYQCIQASVHQFIIDRVVNDVHWWCIVSPNFARFAYSAPTFLWPQAPLVSSSAAPTTVENLDCSNIMWLVHNIIMLYNYINNHNYNHSYMWKYFLHLISYYCLLWQRCQCATADKQVQNITDFTQTHHSTM